MGKFVQPKVFVIGYTTMDWWGLKEYLKYTDQEEFLDMAHQARKEGLSDGEILCSVYAKTCYKALTDRKNKNIKRVRNIHDNLINTYNQGHGCYDEETDVLTSDGWKNWKDVTGEEDFATIDCKGELEYQKATGILLGANYKGGMYKVETQHVDLFVTATHKLLINSVTTNFGKRKNSFKLVEAYLANGKNYCFRKDATWRQGKIINRAEMELLGFTIGDGYINPDRKRVIFHLKKERKINYLRTLCSLLGKELAEYENGHYSIYWEDKYTIYNEDREKIIPQNLLTSCNRESLEGLYAGLINSDGSISNTGTMFCTTSKILAGQFQQLCLHLGYAANISQATSYLNKKDPWKPIYVCYAITRSLRPEVNRTHYQDEWITNWEGKVYCVEVPNHTLYVRRNGKTVFAGNSVFENATVNFIATDVSRILTHELVRHRAGWAYSQTSGRFVRGDSIDIVFDPILEPVKELCEEVQAYIEKMYKEMCERLDLDNVTNKKKLTSALRRFLPNGQTNEICFSVNFRALRHFIMLRTSRFAEWEIRHIANQIYNLLKGKFPTLFHGAKEKEVDGLLEIYGMKLQPGEITADDPEAVKLFSTEMLQNEINNRR